MQTWPPLPLSASGLILIDSETFSGTSIDFDDVFTSDFDMYRLLITGYGSAASVAFQFRASGSVISTNNYDKTDHIGRNGGTSSGTTTAASSWLLHPLANVFVHVAADLFAPALARQSSIMVESGTHSNPAASNTANGIIHTFLTHRLATAYDGFRLTFGASQAGRVSVFGYNQ